MVGYQVLWIEEYYSRGYHNYNSSSCVIAETMHSTRFRNNASRAVKKQKIQNTQFICRFHKFKM